MKLNLSILLVFAAICAANSSAFAQTASASPCVVPRFENFRKEFASGYPNYERVSNAFLPYAVASLNAYRENKTFTIQNYDPKWMQLPLDEIGVEVPQWNGFDMTSFAQESDTNVEILVSFRGTDDFKDWVFGNASWVTQWAGGMDQYQSARTAFDQISAWATGRYKNKNVFYTLVGHSLGGGIAQHIARGNFCARAVAFNSSCVTNGFRNEKTYPTNQIVLIYEDKDPLSNLCNRFFKVASDEDTQVYGSVNLILKSAKGLKIQHSMEMYSAGMSRMVLCCAQRTRLMPKSACSSKIDSASIQRIRSLFCNEHERNTLDEACDFTGKRALEDPQCVAK